MPGHATLLLPLQIEGLLVLPAGRIDTVQATHGLFRLPAGFLVTKGFCCSLADTVSELVAGAGVGLVGAEGQHATVPADTEPGGESGLAGKILVVAEEHSGR